MLSQKRRVKKNSYQRKSLLYKPSSQNITPSKKRRFLNKRLFIRFLYVGFIYFLYWFFISSAFEVKVIDVSGIGPGQSESLRNKIKTLNNGLLSKNYYLFSLSSLEVKLLKEMPELKKIEITKNSKLRGISIAAKLREAKFNWETAGENYEVDMEGIVVKKGARNENFISVIDRASLPLKVGGGVGNAEFILFIEKISKGFEEANIKIVSIITKNEFKRDIEVKTENGYLVYFDATRDSDSQMTSLKRVLSEVNKEKKALEYVDLRIENRIFYK